MLFHQDNAPTHKSAVTTIKTVFGLGLELIQVIDHPPYSPDRAPWDLFPELQKHFAGAHFTTTDAIVAACRGLQVGRTSLSLALGNMVVARQILLIFNLSYLPCSVQFVNKNYCHAKNDLLITC